jgi:Outer membrane protein beta-barrel domain
MKKMKKILLSLVAVSGFAVAVQAQSDVSYDKGNVLVNAGIGVGNLYWGSGFKSTLPVNPAVSVEYGITENISVGAAASYSGAKISGTGYEVKYTGIFFGARGSYHFATSEKLDPYAGLSLGYVSASVKDKSGSTAFVTAKSSGLGWGAHVGVRYYFQPNIGVYGELGASSFSILNLGAAFKF